MLTFGISHRGFKRNSNQDRFFCREFENGVLLMSVADGMGGQAEGATAAQLAIDVLGEVDPALVPTETELKRLIREADRRVRQYAEQNEKFEGMGTTLTITAVRKKIAYWAHVGDSRLYVFRGGELSAMTMDHTIPGFLLADGKITKKEAMIHPMRSGLLDCVGCGSLDLDSGRFDVSDGDLLMLTTDGLHDYVSEQTIQAILRSEHGIEDKFQELVDAALETGGHDNITVVGAQF